MSTFKFLQISKDRYDHLISCEYLTNSGESWQEALQNELKHLPDNYLYEIHDIFRFEDGNFESCINEIWAEGARRREIEDEKEKQKLLLEKEKNQQDKLALYLELKKEFEGNSK